jgi:hypothetical protein
MFLISGFGVQTQEWTEPFLYLNVSVNTTFTLLIVGRLLVHRNSVKGAFGNAQSNSSQYIGVVAMLIESCAIYSVVGLTFAVLLSRSSPAVPLLRPLTVMAQVRSCTGDASRVATSLIST